MIKFVVLFREPIDGSGFENAYNDFLALAERMPNILRRQVVHVMGSPNDTARYYRMIELYFESVESMRATLMTPAGQEAGAELARFPSETIEMLYAEVYEEEGGNTPSS